MKYLKEKKIKLKSNLSQVHGPHNSDTTNKERHKYECNMIELRIKVKKKKYKNKNSPAKDSPSGLHNFSFVTMEIYFFFSRFRSHSKKPIF